MNALTSALRILGQHKPVTFDTPHTVTLSVLDWMAICCAIANSRHANEQQGWNETANLQGELLDRLNEQVREQIDGAGDAEEMANG